MGREYQIKCEPLKDEPLAALLRKLPSPIAKPKIQEIYNYRVEVDGYYLVDHLVDRRVAAQALQIFIDAALSSSNSVAIQEP